MCERPRTEKLGERENARPYFPQREKVKKMMMMMMMMMMMILLCLLALMFVRKIVSICPTDCMNSCASVLVLAFTLLHLCLGVCLHSCELLNMCLNVLVCACAVNVCTLEWLCLTVRVYSSVPLPYCFDDSYAPMN